MAIVASQARILHRETGTLLADQTLGWEITPLEGNLYVSRKYVKTKGFRLNFLLRL